MVMFSTPFESIRHFLPARFLTKVTFMSTRKSEHDPKMLLTFETY